MTVLPNNNSSSTNMRAPHVRFRYGRSVYLITAAEMAANGFASGASPSAIGWNYLVSPGLVGSGTLVVYMQNSTDVTNTKSTTWSAAITGMTVVHNAATTLPNVTGPFDVTLAGAPQFVYTGGSLYVAFDWQYPTGTLSTTVSVSCNNLLTNGLLGNQSNTAPPTTLTASGFRPETRLTPAVSIINNDVSVDYVIGPGSLPLGLVGPQIIQAVVTNRGSNPQANVPVTLNITGIESFFDVQVVPALAACGGQAVVTFAAFTPTLLGSDLMTASVPPDDLPGNNSTSRSLNVNLPLYSYKHPGSTLSGGVGLTGATGAFAAKFTTTAATNVTNVNLEFATASATTYRVAIYGDAGGGVPGLVPLYLDAADRTVGAAGPVTITLPSPVAVGPGSFFAGIQQTNTTNASCSFDAESPIRSGAFFFASPNPPAAWTDFAPGNNFKLNIGVTLDRCYMIVASAGPGGSIAPSGIVVVACDGSQLFNITPDAGYQIQDVLVDGVSQGPIPSYEFTHVLSDHTIHAEFASVQAVPADPHATIAGDEPDGSIVSFGAGAIPPIPPGFFGPGSDPFYGTVCLRGDPLAGGSFGDASTLVQRSSHPFARTDPPGSTATVPIEIVALSLVSCQPITVTYSGGPAPEHWNVLVERSVVPAPPGTLHATKTHANGGTFSSQFYVQPRFTFTKVCGPPTPLVLDTGELGMPPLPFSAPDGYWVHDLDPALHIFAPSDGNFVPGVQETIPGDPSSQELRRMIAQEASGAARHTVFPAQPIPPPPPDPHATISGTEPDGSIVSFGVGAIPPIPPGFFGPGSDPFEGTVCLNGDPLGGFGDGSTLVRRFGDPFGRTDPPGSTAAVPIEIVALNLVSCQPITVTYSGGQAPEPWNLRVGLSVLPPPPGTLQATKTHCNGGTWSSQFYVQPLFTFTSVGNGNQIDLDTGVFGLPPLLFAASDGHWVHDVNPALQVIAPSDSNFVPGVLEFIPGDPSSQELRRAHAQEGTGAARHTVFPARPLTVAVPAASARGFWMRSRPNPFSSDTRIDFALPERGPLSIRIYSLSGQLVQTLIDGVVDGGAGSAIWDGRDSRGAMTASGLYLCKVVSNGKTTQTKLARLR
jgi:hypothetical protein